MRDLKKSIRKKNAILFVGAGVSMNLGLPSFQEFINHIARELDFDPDIFNLYGDYYSLAEFYKIKKGSLGKLRSWMDRKWHDPNIKIENSKIHKLIVDLDFPIIYTTNYDRWLENAFGYYGKEYHKISNVSDIVQIREGLTQIIKFHGDFDYDESIVLTESSYFDRLGFETPLDIKLRSDTLGKSILFIGYSLTDINIRYLLYKLYKQWSESEFFEFRPKSYIFLTNPNPVRDKILLERKIFPVVSEMDNFEKGLEKFLRNLKTAK